MIICIDLVSHSPKSFNVASMAMPSFHTLSGAPLKLATVPTSVQNAREQIKEMLQLRYLSQIVFVPSGSEEELKDCQELPQTNIQVQICPPPEYTWLRIMADASTYDEHKLQEALNKAFPLPPEEINFSSLDWGDRQPEDFWSNEELWARWTARAMQEATVKTVGSWADYWKFAKMGDTYGYWMVEAPYRSKNKTVEMVVSNVAHWKMLLQDLDVTFAALKERTKHMTIAEKWQIACAELLKFSPNFAVKTSFKYGFETWYRPFLQVLEWYADFAEMELHPRSFVDGNFDRNGKLTLVLTPWGDDGVFSSYTVKADGAKVFAEKMAQLHGIEFESFDSTQQWFDHRNSLLDVRMGVKTSDHAFCNEDVHFHYIRNVDGARSPERAERLTEALHLVRQHALAKKKLTLETLSEWQAVVLGLDNLRLRSTDAYAKQGRERYPYSEKLQEVVGQVLSDAFDSSLIPEVRAARAFLDICFVHPFDDGNGRLARLVLDFVLTSSMRALQDVGGLFGVSRRADDRRGAEAFLETLLMYTAPLGSHRDDDLKKWCTVQRNQSLLELPPRKGYQWFDCVTDEFQLRD